MAATSPLLSPRPEAPRLSLVSPPTPSSSPPAKSELHFSARALGPLVRWIEETQGSAAVTAILEQAGTSAEDIRGGSAWLSQDTFASIYAAARELTDSDEAFAAACTHKIVEVYGAMTLVLRAASIRYAYEAMARTSNLAFRAGSLELESSSRTSCRLVYRTSLRETHLGCLARQAQFTAVPLIWGLPSARCEHTRCVVRGDDACVYDLSWMEVAGLVRPLVGILAGLVTAALLAWLGVLGFASTPALAGVGFLIGLIMEHRRASFANSRHAEEARRALETLAADNAQAAHQVQAMHDRQDAWTRILEQRLEERRRAFDAVRGEMEAVGAKRRRAIRSISHDLRSPLTVATLNAEFVRASLPEQDPDAQAAADDLIVSLGRFDAILRGLVEMADADGELLPVRAATMDVAPIADRVRGVLHALTMHRDIRVSVFSTREKPAAIVTDVVMFDRVLDNILTNAAKYTEKGSIVVEVGGKPGHLCIKVSDTGRGMDQSKIEHRFRVARPDANPMVGDSHGHGLSIAVRLLDALGGRMEVMSEEGVGTTFWLHFPSEMPNDRAPKTSGDAPIDAVLERTLHIRRVANDS